MNGQFLIDKLGMKSGEKKRASFGDSVEFFSGKIFSLRVINEKGSEFIEIASNTDSDNWFDLALLKTMIKGEMVSGNPTPIPILQDFLFGEILAIENAFAPKEYPITQEKLKNLGAERARIMFPKGYK